MHALHRLLQNLQNLAVCYAELQGELCVATAPLEGSCVLQGMVSDTSFVD